MTSGEAEKRRCQKLSRIKATRSAPGEPSLAVRSRPSRGTTDSTHGRVRRRAVGMASTDEKCRLLTEKLGYYGAINYTREDVSARMFDGATMAFHEDKAVLEEVHRGMKDPATPYLNLGLDAGAMRFRKLVEAMIAAERAT